MQGARFLPIALWATGWTSPLSRSSSITLDTLAEHVYTSATGQTDAQLSVTCHDLGSLVLAFETVLSNRWRFYTGPVIKSCFSNVSFVLLWLRFDS